MGSLNYFEALIFNTGGKKKIKIRLCGRTNRGGWWTFLILRENSSDEGNTLCNCKDVVICSPASGVGGVGSWKNPRETFLSSRFALCRCILVARLISIIWLSILSIIGLRSYASYSPSACYWYFSSAISILFYLYPSYLECPWLVDHWNENPRCVDHRRKGSGKVAKWRGSWRWIL